MSSVRPPHTWLFDIGLNVRAAFTRVADTAGTTPIQLMAKIKARKPH